MCNVTRKIAFATSLLLGTLVAKSAWADVPPTTSVVMTPQFVHQHDGHEQVKISPNGRVMASLHRGSIYVWDVESGTILRTLSPPGSPRFAFTNDGEHLRYVTVSIVNGKATLLTGDWNLITGESTQSNGPAGLFVAAVVPGAKRAILGENPMGTVHVYDLDNNKIVRSFGTPPSAGTPANQLDPRTISVLSVPTNGQFVLFQRVNGSLELWDVEKKERRYAEANPSQSITNKLAIASDGSRAICIRIGSDRKELLDVIDVASGKRLQSITLDKIGTGGLAISADGHRALTTSTTATSGLAQLWNLDTGAAIQSITADEMRTTTVPTFVTQDQFLWGGPNRLELWSLQTRSKVQSFLVGTKRRSHGDRRF
jgi:WD40 repeat protein